ncbi:pitrilysin family protein [Albimonas sp. CAU 1670]|uniref:M16 family metallopeptidase n=1 Tax=Albimonas sp. CAU 1670 TaxID=3032599 RepID=UPI0023DB3373|nr:pitrilysin family protein [Albimonas sp. CAU 1670]MDF2233703.1 pitrilysin family protein [Albimonas sp. CAU 1670]
MTLPATGPARLRSRGLRAAPALAVLASAVSLTAALVAAPAGAEPRTTTFELDNGLRAVVIEDHRAPVVTHMVWYRIGAADEPPGKSGIAHFLEHLMFKGTDEIPDAAFSKIVAANGGQDNAFTSRDYTGYFQRIAADRLGLVMKMEADRMRDLVLTDAQVTPERQVIIEERNSRTDTNPGAIFGEQRDAALYMNHPYGIPIIGWRQEMEGLTRQDALDFYKTYYAPNNAILVVAGDVTPEEVERLAKEWYGPLAPTPDLPERARPMEPPQLAERRLIYEDARIGQPYVMREYLTIARRDDQAKAAALQVLADVLGDGINSRFSQAMVVGGGVALQAGAWYSGDWRDYGEFGLYVVPSPGHTLQEGEDAMDATLADFLASGGPTEEELARIKMGYRSAEVYRQDSQMALAREYGQALASDYTLEQIKDWPDLLQAVTAQDVMAAAQEVFDKRRSVTGWLRKPAGADAAQAAPVAPVASQEEQG